MKNKQTKANLEKDWVVKDRHYYLLGDKQPIVRIMRSKGIMWFDEDLGYERELCATTNQKTVFVDEMKGARRLTNIIFRDGTLTVRKNQQNIQKLLSLYHPDKGHLFEETDHEAKAIDDIDLIELRLDAMNIAKGLDVDHAEAVLRSELGNKVSRMKSKEIKRDLLLFAQGSPKLFLDLVKDDNINIRNIGIKAVEQDIINLSNDNRTFTVGKNKRKLLTVPFDENPYSALAVYFKTDEGIEVYNSVLKKLK
jgi:hypothetical protein